MKLSILVLIYSAALALTVGIMHYVLQGTIGHSIITFAVAFGVSYIAFYYLLERYVYSKIKLIYKLINNLKLGPEIKEAIGEYVSSDPINDVEQVVKEWAGKQSAEMEGLRRQEKFRKEFLSNVSHEFKTPLFSIQGYIDAVRDNLYDDPEQADMFLQKVEKNAERLGYLISDLDAISRLETGEIRIEESRFDFVKLVDEVFESIEDRAEAKHIKLVFKEKYRNPTIITADREKLRQVLINLLVNSIKYGKEGGSTAVKTFELHQQYLIEITDNGIGIEEKHLPRLFERFYRVDSHRARAEGGTGLGLAIVKHIVEAHKQIITVRSTPNIGTTFAFTMLKS